MDRYRFRQIANWANLSTPLGLALARVGGAEVRAADRHVLIASGYRPGFPVAGAFTVGSVIITRYDHAWLTSRPELLGHEEQHSWQYVACLGLPFLPLYAAAMAWSRLRAGDRASRNLFERSAGLEPGGYLRRDSSERARGRRALLTRTNRSG